MTPQGLVAGLQVVSTLGLVVIAALTIRNWIATRDPGRRYLVLAITSLAAVSLIGQVGKLLGPGFASASAYLTVVLFLTSGLALMLFRDSVMPLRRLTRRLVIAIVGITAVLEILVQLLLGKGAPRPVQLLSVVAFVLVWSGCVLEPSVRLWLESRGRTAVQRAKMRTLSLAYFAIVLILVAAVFSAALASSPVVQIAFALAGVAIVPLLYAGFVPAAWLRRIWRQGEEAKFQEATHDIVLYAPDQATLASRALDWAVRLAGADAGFFLGSDHTLLSVRGMTEDDAARVQQRLDSTAQMEVVALGGTPPRNAMVVPMPGTEACIVLVSGPFTPIFGSDEHALIRQYATLVGTGLDRVRLVEDVERINRELHTKIEEVTQRTHQLEMANRELEAYSYTISHDLRAPLRAINGFTSILLEEHGQDLDEQARGYLKRVKDNGEHMGHLVDDLLAFSRFGRQALRTQTVKTRGVVDRALAQLEPGMQDRKVELLIGELPDCQADPALLEQVYVNLLSNALKYSRNRETARIEVGANPGDAPTFFVRDNGTGFDMAYADKLFGVFQRLHRSQDYEGTGVGLAIVHRIIDRHGGRIWAEAQVDHGATFYFTVGGVQEWRQTKAA